jgi:hypothetical protein
MFTYSFKSNNKLKRVVISGHHLILYVNQENILELQHLINQFHPIHTIFLNAKSHPFQGYIHSDFLSFDKYDASLTYTHLALSEKHCLQDLKKMADFLIVHQYISQHEIIAMIKSFEIFSNKKNLYFFITAVTKYTEKIDLKISEFASRRETTTDDNALLEYYHDFFRLQEALLGIQHKNSLYWHQQVISSLSAIKKSAYSKRFNTDLFNEMINSISAMAEAGKDKLIIRDLAIITLLSGIGYAYAEMTSRDMSATTLKNFLQNSIVVSLLANIAYQAAAPIKQKIINIHRFFSAHTSQIQQPEISTLNDNVAHPISATSKP